MSVMYWLQQEALGEGVAGDSAEPSMVTAPSLPPTSRGCQAPGGAWARV